MRALGARAQAGREAQGLLVEHQGPGSSSAVFLGALKHKEAISAALGWFVPGMVLLFPLLSSR